LDPVILHTVLDRQLTSITFASKSSIILTGDDNGSVNVYSLRHNTVSTFPNQHNHHHHHHHHHQNGKQQQQKPVFAAGDLGSVPAGMEAEYAEWFDAQASQLTEVILSKNQTGGSNATPVQQQGGNTNGGNGGSNST
jgi:hypothetical protein